MARGITLILLIVQLGGCLVEGDNTVINAAELFTLDKSKCLDAMASLTDVMENCQKVVLKAKQNQDNTFIIEKSDGSEGLILGPGISIDFSDTSPVLQLSDGSVRLAYGQTTLHTVLNDKDSGIIIQRNNADAENIVTCLAVTGLYTESACDANTDRFYFELDCSSIVNCESCELTSSLPNIACLTCGNDRIPSTDGSECDACATFMPGCSKCTATDVCTECDNGKTADSKCTECGDEKLEKDGACVTCDSLMSGCTKCTAEDVCTECDNDRTAESKCTECEDGKSEKDGACVEGENGENAASFTAQVNYVVFVAIGLLLLL